jgi:hypothetical protein
MRNICHLPDPPFFSLVPSVKADFSGNWQITKHLKRDLVPFFSQIIKRQGRRKYRGGDSQGGKIADIDDRN